MLKAEIEKENALLKNKIANLENYDQHVRKEFSRVLGREEKRVEYFGHTTTVKETLAWEEIFCRVGQLKAHTKYDQVTEQCEELHSEIRKLEHQLAEARSRPA